MSRVLFEKQGPVAIVTLNRPERLNAISGPMLDDMHDTFLRAQHDAEVKAIVLCGAGRAFCAGDDLKEFSEQTATAEGTSNYVDRIQQVTRDIMFSGKPVIGAIQGYAVGGGFEWVLNCDMVVASEDLLCFFPEMAWGQFVTGGVTHLLPRAVGYQRAMELWLLGEKQSAAALHGLGLVNRVVPKENVLSTAIELAQRISERSTFTVSRLKKMVNMQLSGQLAAALQLEADATSSAMGHEDTRRRVAGFASK
ncbi:enoyl-CoA hydratase/isomerase family protein [Polaromonas jejuensis]|uniref:Enoyl-CoA hydratase/isomerase family protein n=1 Tax=Polaromonas jejuensis TaxID=457502 RepID=A0ABW0QE54_9BURK|nr:enoyl-CoA hydratase/isomerase family protein [Polaromonas jejuensis]